MSDAEDPALFYRGLVADLYEPLAGEHARAADYVPFLEKSGTPALELACGSGLPILELREQGWEVEGLDASTDMLPRCRAAAAARGIDVTLHRGEMQSFSLPRRYRSIFLAGASFTLLTNDDDAKRALRCIHEHLEPGGSALIPLEVPDVELSRRALHRVREATNDAGERLRVSMVAFEEEADGRTHSHRLRYERVSAAGESEVVERDWRKRWWSQGQFRELLLDAGFARANCVAPGGGPAAPDAPLFIALAQKASEIAE